MPDTRQHRGPHPDDEGLFSPSQLIPLQSASGDLAWLLNRGYAQKSSMKLVGDRYLLTTRQRIAVSRCTCTDAAASSRRNRLAQTASLRGKELWIDGYNVLTSVEAALSGGVLIRGRDGCLRDMASMHGSYRQVQETERALQLIGSQLAHWAPRHVRWYLDEPVSNSGRLRGLILEIARQHNWDWDVRLVPNPDPILSAAECCVATADSEVLDRAARWLNLVDLVVEADIPEAWIVDVGQASSIGPA
jgi:hypothetical protein